MRDGNENSSIPIPPIQWEIESVSTDALDADEFINDVKHSRNITGKVAWKAIEEFILDPDFLGFQPAAGEFPQSHAMKTLSSSGRGSLANQPK